MNKLDHAVAVCADFGAATGGFLGEVVAPAIQAMLDTKDEALHTRGRIVAEYADSQAKTDCLVAVDAHIDTFPGGG